MNASCHVFSLILIIASTPLLSQTNDVIAGDTINYTDKYGQPQFQWKIFYKEGRIFCEVYYKDGVFHGPCKFYYPNGKIRSQGFYADGIKAGKWQYFDETGKLWRDESILEKGIDELWQQYDKNNNLILKGREKQEMLNGEYRTYYQNGALNSLSNYRNGKKEGRWLWYYKNGNLLLEQNYKNGKLEGPIHIFYKNGKPEYSSLYKKGKNSGIAETFYENGILAERGKFRGNFYKVKIYTEKGELSEVFTLKDGKLHGKYKSFYTNNLKINEGLYINGRKEGEWRLYSRNGKLLKVTFFKGDEVVREIIK